MGLIGMRSCRCLWIGGAGRSEHRDDLWLSIAGAVNARRLQRAVRGARAVVVCEPLRTPVELLSEIDRTMPVLIVGPPDEHNYQLDEWLPAELGLDLTPFDLVVRQEASAGEALGPYGVWSRRLDGSERLESIVCRWMRGEFLGESGEWADNVVRDGPEWSNRTGLQRCKGAHKARIATLRRVVQEIAAEMPGWKSLRAVVLAGWPDGMEVVLDPFGWNTTVITYGDLARMKLGEGSSNSGKLPAEDEEYDVALSPGFLWRNDEQTIKSLVGELWRVVRPGGRIVWMDEVVSPPEGDGAQERRSINELVYIFEEASLGQLSLERVESVEYPDDVIARCALIEFRRLGVPGSW